MLWVRWSCHGVPSEWPPPCQSDDRNLSLQRRTPTLDSAHRRADQIRSHPSWFGVSLTTPKVDFPAPMHSLLTLARLPASTRTPAIEASLLLLLARTLVARLPMRCWRRRVDVAAAGAAEPDAPIPGEARHRAHHLCRIVRKVRSSGRPSGRCACRRRWRPSGCCAAAASRAGSFSGRGGARDPNSNSHAWLTVGGKAVLGGGEGSSVAAPWSRRRPWRGLRIAGDGGGCAAPVVGGPGPDAAPASRSSAVNRRFRRSTGEPESRRGATPG